MKPSPSIKRLRVGLVILAVIIIVAVFGYHMAGRDLLDSIFMVVITLSGVGYGEDSHLETTEKLFTILVIVFGLTTGFYIIGGFVQMMAEGEINRAMGVRRVTREIEHLSGHVVVCGFGRVGATLAEQLQKRDCPFVVLDNDPDQIAEASANGYLALTDDATEEEALLSAGVQRARATVIALPSDADNVFITLTARNLNPDLQIIARAGSPSTEKKLLQAGADRVVLPAAAGAMRMATMLTRPSTIELIELAAGRHAAEVELDELTIPASSSLVGATVRNSQTRAKHGLLIVAVRHVGGELLFNPDADTKFLADDTVIIMGRMNDIERFRKHHGI
jgi:voltage-gated potassium channel